jgi:ATP-dependent Clp protease ATP-binding subunit ClpB
VISKKRPETLFVLSMKFVSVYGLIDASKNHLITCLDTLFNLGKAEGSVDAGQMIKPALARGLQLVGATTRE